MRDCRTATSTRQRPLCLVRRVAAFDGIPSRYASAACNHRRSRISPPPRFRRSDQSLEVKAGSSHHAVAAARTQPCTRGCRVTTGATLRAFVHGLAPSCYTKLHSASTAPEPPLAIRAPEAEEPNAEPVRERERGASESEARGHSRRQVAGRGGRRTLSACIRPATTLSVSAAERAAEMLLRICCFCCVSPLASLLTEASAIGGSVCAPPSTLSAAMRCERSHASYRRCCRHWTSAKLPLPGMKRFPERRIATRRGAGQHDRVRSSVRRRISSFMRRILQEATHTLLARSLWALTEVHQECSPRSFSPVPLRCAWARLSPRGAWLRCAISSCEAR